MKKRMLSLLLSFAMLLSLLPSAAMAAEPVSETGTAAVSTAAAADGQQELETSETQAQPAEADGSISLLEGETSQNANGTTGDVSWSYDAASKTMTISGTGNMGAYSPWGSRPWDSFRDEITKLVVESGVTDVGNAVCYKWSNLEEAVLPNTVTKIGSNAFNGCKKLSKITIPTSVTTLSDAAFEGCASLTSIVLPDSVTSVDGSVFSDCTSLKEVTLPKNLTQISSSMFDGCKSLTDITIPSTVTTINYYAFRDCSALKSIVVPDSVTDLSSGVFYDCTSLTSVTLPKELKNVGYDLFNGCSALAQIDIPTTVTTICEQAFSNCSALTNITIPDSVTSLGDGVFSNCTGLTSVTIPAGVTVVPASLFRSCTKLTSVTFAGKITEIGANAFNDCTSLTAMTVPATVTKLGNAVFSECPVLASVELPAAITALPKDLFLNCKSLTSVTIPSAVTTLGANMFSGCTGLTSVEIPSGVTAIPDKLFNGCTGLTSVTLPSAITTVGKSAFNGCTGLKTVTLSEGITKIDSNAFDGCTALASVSLPSSVTELGDSVFNGCTSFTDMTVPAATVGKQLFKDCTGLKTATIKAAGEEMFSGCTALTKVTFLDGATTLGSKTFTGCTALKEIVVPASLTDWGSDAFGGLDHTKITFSGAGKDNFAISGGTVYNVDKTILFSVDANTEGEFTVPATVTTLGANCFVNCTKLTGVAFAEGSKLTTINSGAFSGCTALTGVTLPETVTTIDSDAFNGCAALGQIVLPASVTAIGDRAFQNCAKLTKLDLPKALTDLGSEFAAGTAVEEIIIPENVTEVKPFGTCDSLKRVVVRPQLTKLSGMLWTKCKNLESLVMPSTLVTTSYNMISFKDSFRVIYFTGTLEQFQNLNLYKNRNSKPYFTSGQVAVVSNYVEPTTETGKLEVVQQPANIKTNTILAAAGQVSLQLKYPEGTAPKEGDKIWADWYHTAETPNGLHHVFQFSSYDFDADTLTTSVDLGEQAAKGPNSTWHYICVAYKTDADGNTTMMVSQPVTVEMEEKTVELSGTGTETDPYQIGTFEQLVAVATKLNSGSADAASHLELTNDLTLPKGWMQIGTESKPFRGVFDGKGHTVTYEKGAKSLFDRVSGGKIQNVKLKGEYILGSALASAAPGAEITGCTLLSGSATQKSGILTVAGSGSGYNAVDTDISNCTVESGVKIGWNGIKNCPTGLSDVGSITGGGNFTIRDCKSAATVYGISNVGGIVGVKGSSMGAGMVSNSQFTGEIIATGEYIGGIMGRGYDSYTAPNSPCARINNCYVNANITGVQAVGGIYGGEGGVDQCWSNGVGQVRNCLFIGGLTLAKGTFPAQAGASYPAANVGGTKGGVIGFMRALNKYNDISNNYYYVTNGSEKAIGAVEHIDTSAIRPMGMHDDGTFYYDTSVDDLAAIKDFVDAEDKDTSDESYSSVINKNSNRTDDPLGADKDKLGKNCTKTELTDGSVLKLLNTSETSLHNWVQGENGPELSDQAVPYLLEISGTYKTEYYIGEDLDMTGAVFTATWSDGEQTQVDLKDIAITGFDSSKRAVLTLRASYQNATCEFTVKVLKDTSGGSSTPSTITVYFTLLGDTHHGEDTIHTLKDKNLITWISETRYTVDANATVADLLTEVEKSNDQVSFSNPKGNWVDAVTFGDVTLEQLDNTTGSGWMYTLNGKHPLLVVNEQFLENNDRIIFHWTDDYTVEEGSEPWNGGGSSGGSGSTVSDTTAAAAVDKLIDAIGTVTADSKAKIESARSAYDKLTAEQKKLVKNYEQLVKAESALAQLTVGVPFVDVENHWALNAIKYAYENKLMYGVDSNRFAPDISLTRGMLVTMLYRMAGEPAVTGESRFTDVASGAWYAAAVKWAANNGVVMGVSEHAFAPAENITREQFAAMLYRFAQHMKYRTDGAAELDRFSDAASVSDWAQAAMKWAVGNGLINGRTDTTIVPGGAATRAEAATLLMLFAQNVAK